MTTSSKRFYQLAKKLLSVGTQLQSVEDGRFVFMKNGKPIKKIIAAGGSAYCRLGEGGFSDRDRKRISIERCWTSAFATPFGW